MQNITKNPFSEFLKVSEEYSSVIQDTELEPYDKSERLHELEKKIAQLKQNYPEIREKSVVALKKLLADV